MTHQERLYKALKSECEADVNEALLTLDMCMTNSSAIGEHTSKHFLEEASKSLHKLTEAEDRLNTLESYVEGSSLFSKNPY
jgi:hypothetical protein|tara:strand:- start:506 stop:748 length:243 start_codon:yes stop_codon:yes gene_type:complete